MKPAGQAPKSKQIKDASRLAARAYKEGT